jgi:hypothetical protein
VSYVSVPCLLIELGSGAITCPVVLDLIFRLR